MTQRTKTALTTIAVIGVIFAGGIYYNAETNEVIEPANLPQLTFTAYDDCKVGDIIRMKVNEGLSFWKEPYFTLNDIRSEINLEERINGQTDRLSQLQELLNEASSWVDTFPACEGERISDEVSSVVENLDLKVDALIKK